MNRNDFGKSETWLGGQKVLYSVDNMEITLFSVEDDADFRCVCGKYGCKRGCTDAEIGGNYEF